MNPALTDVPETMLWTLHNRASEASRPDGVFDDPEAIRIYRALDYDYERSFGPAEASHALRSMLFDRELRRFAEAYADAVVVNLGEGLETQRYRVDVPGLDWVSVDLPDAQRVRERFITPDARHRHVARSALDTAWFDEVPPGRPTFITAQGLFMYFAETDLRPLVAAMAERFAGGALMFDAIPPWLSKKTMAPGGGQKTPHYTTPPMPWGIKRSALETTLRSWAPSLRSVTPLRYPRFPRGFLNRYVFELFARTPGLRDLAPQVALVRFGEG